VGGGQPFREGHYGLVSFAEKYDVSLDWPIAGLGDRLGRHLTSHVEVWANGLVITIAVAISLYGVVRGLLGIPIAGSIPLFLAGVAIYLFFACAIGIFLATIARSMPQLGLLYMLVFMPMNLLYGSNTPRKACRPGSRR
jgi:hypothetical protein